MSSLANVEQDGRTITLTAIRMHATYAGLLDGRMPPDRWLTVLMREGHDVHVLEDSRQTSPDGDELLAPIAIWLTMESGPLPTSDADYSTLDVLWLATTAEFTPQQCLETVLERIRWDERAIDADA